jgi:hypothetical protein
MADNEAALRLERFLRAQARTESLKNKIGQLLEEREKHEAEVEAEKNKNLTDKQSSDVWKEYECILAQYEIIVGIKVSITDRFCMQQN